MPSDPELASEILFDMKDSSDEKDDGLSHLSEFEKSEIRMQFEFLSDQALVQKLGAKTPLRSQGFLNGPASLETQLKVSSIIHRHAGSGNSSEDSESDS